MKKQKNEGEWSWKSKFILFCFRVTAPFLESMMIIAAANGVKTDRQENMRYAPT
jgi:hypothetical protein